MTKGSPRAPFPSFLSFPPGAGLITRVYCMESPEYLKISTASAMALGFKHGRFYRGAKNPCINLLLTYDRGCAANCAYCGLARPAARSLGREELHTRLLAHPVHRRSDRPDGRTEQRAQAGVHLHDHQSPLRGRRRHRGAIGAREGRSSVVGAHKPDRHEARGPEAHAGSRGGHGGGGGGRGYGGTLRPLPGRRSAGAGTVGFTTGRCWTKRSPFSGVIR